jgi:hypothetical protein
MYWASGGLLLLAWGLTGAAQAEPVTLTLACKGITTQTMLSDAKPEPISMGIIVNFTARTVQGFGFPGMLDYRVSITAANDVAVAFGGHQEVMSSVSSIEGSIDRVTGDVEATSTLSDPKTNKMITQTAYAIQCRPTQRMF